MPDWETLLRTKTKNRLLDKTSSAENVIRVREECFVRQIVKVTDISRANEEEKDNRAEVESRERIPP